MKRWRVRVMEKIRKFFGYVTESQMRYYLETRIEELNCIHNYSFEDYSIKTQNLYNWELRQTYYWFRRLDNQQLRTVLKNLEFKTGQEFVEKARQRWAKS